MTPLSGMEQQDFFANGPALELAVEVNVAQACVILNWLESDEERKRIVISGRLTPFSEEQLQFQVRFIDLGHNEIDYCRCNAPSIAAFERRLRRVAPLASQPLRFYVCPDLVVDAKQEIKVYSVQFERDSWSGFRQTLRDFGRLSARFILQGYDTRSAARAAAYLIGCSWMRRTPDLSWLQQRDRERVDVRVTMDVARFRVEIEWLRAISGQVLRKAAVSGQESVLLKCQVVENGKAEEASLGRSRDQITDYVSKMFEKWPADGRLYCRAVAGPGSGTDSWEEEMPMGAESASAWVSQAILGMAEAPRGFNPPARADLEWADLPDVGDFERYERRLMRKQAKEEERQARIMEAMERKAREREEREREAGTRKKASPAGQAGLSPTPTAIAVPLPQSAIPPLPLRISFDPFEVQETAFPLLDLKQYFLRENAALWWVSNQSDDLLCLPYCRIQHLEYQLRTALRVLGPMRGRALLSDEVGLGKTIEAGLVLKELLTRGMVRKFLILTVPSLVDQWQEELSTKFGLEVATTNMSVARDDMQSFWADNPGVLASIHTFKLPAHHELARQTHWDLLVVDEAHYLRNRNSVAWQAVNSLPRQFLLLLTATPVQNSLEELYNLVTLLQAGQLPSPKEFRSRFVDPKRPRTPREPEELRRVLSQVMIRNTRATAGIRLPPRHAETVLFEPEDAERAFWTAWEAELRVSLGALPQSQASLWGRLLLQASGSSPAAWRDALTRFPDKRAVAGWLERCADPLSWNRKCQMLLPLTRPEGGLVIFTQFLHTQAALAEFLRHHSVPTFVINGSTPPPERQPITEEFQRRGGALLLTQSGTEGRNLQFSHQLANFDLPWNPMEIEQRIGRLHRIGQKNPVRIYNFVQAGTLQQHLLGILQEKLNLFELVVGETGLILGDKFSTDEFAEEVLRRWREAEGGVAEAMAGLGEELAAARDNYNEVRQLDETLFAKDYEQL